jgi:hypothetical protein
MAPVAWERRKIKAAFWPNGMPFGTHPEAELLIISLKAGHFLSGL